MEGSIRWLNPIWCHACWDGGVGRYEALQGTPRLASQRRCLGPSGEQDLHFPPVGSRGRRRAREAGPAPVALLGLPRGSMPVLNNRENNSCSNTAYCGFCPVPSALEKLIPWRLTAAPGESCHEYHPHLTVKGSEAQRGADRRVGSCP